MAERLRILGELKKLGIKTSRSNVVNILKAHGLDPNSKRGEGSWQEFIAAHGESLWQADFFSKNIITANGIRQFFCLVFLNVASREAYVSPCTDKPNSAWVEEQTEAFAVHAKALGKPAGMVFRDRDSKYVLFDETLRKHACRVNVLPIRSPNCNAFVERFIQSLGVEVFNAMIVFGPQHFDYLAQEYLAYYHEHRPHQSLGNNPIRPTGDPPASGDAPARAGRPEYPIADRSG